MASKHTPGPWVAEEIGVSDIGPNGVPVYEVRTADGYRRIVDAAGEADARLIAAAPDLLKALQEMLDAFIRVARLEYGPGVTLGPEADAARAAILAATGEQQ